MRFRNTFFALTAALLLQSCLKDTLRHTYRIAIPVYKEKAEVYANIKSNPPRTVSQPGKIFLYGNYIFLNDVNQGVHIIDNSNPAAPVATAFINIPGNLDITIRGNTLYADLYSDLVVVDISNPLNVHFVKYIPHVFPERNYGNYFVADSNRVITDWLYKDTTVTDEFTFSPRYTYDFMLLSSSGGSVAANTGAANPSGISGSMARMVVVNDYLYCVNQYQLNSFSLVSPGDPQYTQSNNLGWDIETIYPFRDKLFIGSSTGMYIFDITNPAIPVQQSRFTHARACDPVVTDGNYAYITLRDGTVCTGTANQLDVVDVQQTGNPFLVKSYPMTNPHGLAKYGQYLYICDGRDGLKVFDASDANAVALKKQIGGMITYDVIAWNQLLLVVAQDGLYQYSIIDPVNPVLKSKISKAN